jgi:hypothetical protein
VRCVFLRSLLSLESITGDLLQFLECLTCPSVTTVSRSCKVDIPHLESHGLPW